MAVSLSTQGYQFILLSVSVHQNELVKQSNMLSFSLTPTPLFFFLFFSSLLNPPSDLFPFYLPASNCSIVFLFSSFPLPPFCGCSFPRSPSPFCRVRNVCMNSIPIISSESERERKQQQDFVNGNLIRSEQGVCNTVHVPGSCLIAFGFVQIWLQFTCMEKVEQKITLMETVDSFFTVLRFLLFDSYLCSRGHYYGYLFKY